MSVFRSRLPDIAGSADPRRELASLGEVFAVFDQQDSGCLSYGVILGATRWFVKLAPTGTTAEMLRSAARFHDAVRHRVIVAPAIFSDLGSRAAIVYPWVAGTVLYHPTRSHRPSRTDPASAFHAFRSQPLPIVSKVVDDIYDAHVAVADAGYVPVDFYDGLTLLYDPRTTRIHLIDLDHYRPGPFTVGPQLLPGSTRYLSPEERTAGSIVDQRTTVYTLGRTALILMDEGDSEQAWRGSAAQRQVLIRATSSNPAERHHSVAQFVTAWRTAQP